MADLDDRLDRLIADTGHMTPAVAKAFRAVPRHLFVPPMAVACPQNRYGTAYGVDRDAGPGEWWDAVYSDTGLVTQLDDGATAIPDVLGPDGEVDLAKVGGYTSSSSAPTVVAYFLRHLDPAPGHRTLEIGTGTGWTAALLAHLVGDQNVTSVEVDAAIAAQTAKHLGEAGVQPHLVVGDGADGCPERAPYDRVHVTCGIRAVPYAWVEQSRPGAVIALPYQPGFGVGYALRLTVAPDGNAYGRIGREVDYMLMRGQRPPELQPADPAQARDFTTRIDPRLIARVPGGADLVISALTGLRCYSHQGEDYQRVWVINDSGEGVSWAAATWEADQEEYEGYQIGDRPVWEEVVDAYFRWVTWGEPGRDRFGMTVTPEGQQLWLDSPEHVIG